MEIFCDDKLCINGDRCSLDRMVLKKVKKVLLFYAITHRALLKGTFKLVFFDKRTFNSAIQHDSTWIW